MTPALRIPDGGLLLDGGLATELQRAGWPMAAPWWTSDALRTEGGRRAVRRIHERYVAAGADVVTANTFRCNPRAMRAADVTPEHLRRLIRAAVGLARAAVGERALVAASLAPAADCYRPDLVPGDDDLRREHGWTARELAAAGSDLVLAETMNSVREAVIAVEAALATGRPVWVSLVCAGGPRLLSGEPLGAAVRVLWEHGASAVLVNCTTLDDTESCLEVMSRAAWRPFGAYPNIENRFAIPKRSDVNQFIPAGIGPAAFARRLATWRTRYGLDVLGGCCGTSPEHLSALRRRLGQAGPARSRRADEAVARPRKDDFDEQSQPG
ncbi:homocysteine S-methyltransferase family protein [Micromonospora sp. NPDC007271]|uniref:homocysteine S-methyltransferase family protein n=1 Tax=Micromonospora sp. NPDC007271 TaxID=3154587 RepID=UPI003409C381